MYRQPICTVSDASVPSEQQAPVRPVYPHHVRFPTQHGTLVSREQEVCSQVNSAFLAEKYFRKRVLDVLLEFICLRLQNTFHLGFKLGTALNSAVY